MTESAEPAIPEGKIPPVLSGKKKKSAASAPKSIPKTLKPLKKQPDETASDILEESFNILRTNSRRLLVFYYMGAFPFAVALLYFINDMSMSHPTRGEMEIYALLLTLCFAWKNLVQSLFCLRIMNILNGKEDGPVGFMRIVRIFVLQNIIQPAGLIVQVFSLLFGLTIGWTTAFFNSFTVTAALDDGSFTELLGSNWRLSFLNPKQNHLLLLLFVFLVFVVVLNIALALVLLPFMAKIFLGIDTIFSNASGSYVLIKGIFNLTYWSIVLTCSWLLLDPLLKAAYTVRVFYGESESRGYDIIAKLSRLVKNSKKARALFVLLIAFQSFSLSAAVEGTGTEKLDSEKLAAAIDETLKEREYKWLMPRPEEAEDVERSFIGDMIDAMGKQIGEWIETVSEYIKKYFPEDDEKQKAKELGSGFSFFDIPSLMPIMLIVLSVLICAFVIYWLRKRRRLRAIPATIYEIKSVPDLTKEDTYADELEKSAWLEMAARLFEEGNFRLAVRAVFFAELCLLADERLLTLAKFKTNREYLCELKRRAHSSKEIIEVFDTTLRLYERAWFGDYETTPEIYSVMQDGVMKIRGRVVS